MSFRGELREFELPDILQLISSQKKAGWLKVISKGKCHFVFFRDGKITSTKNPSEEVDPFETYLAKRRVLPHESLDRLAALRRKTGMDIQDLLQKESLLSREEIQTVFEAMVEEDIFELITIRNATYEFETEERSAPLPKGALVAEIGPILMEAARKADEITEMRRALGPLESTLVLTQAGRDRTRQSDQEEVVLALINGVRTLEAILEECGFDSYTGTHLLYDCAKRGLVARIKGPVGATEVAPEEPGSFELRRAAFWAAPVVGLLLATLALSDTLRQTREDDPLLGEWLGRRSQLITARTRHDIRVAAEAFRVQTGEYPESLEKLASEGYLSRDSLTPLGRSVWDYRLVVADSSSAFVLAPAPNGTPEAVD